MRTRVEKPFVRQLNRNTASQMFEPLESRVMLNADLTPSVLLLSVNQLSGTTQADQVVLHDDGFHYKGSVTSELFVVPNGTFNPATFNPAAALKLNTVKLKADVPSVGQQQLPLPLTLPPGLAAGTYQIVARLTGKGLDPALIVSDPLTVTQPDYDLVPTPVAAKTVVPASLVANSGKAAKGTVQIQLTNSGTSTATIPAKINAAVQVVLRQEGHDDIVISPKLGAAAIGGLAPGASSKAVSVAITLPGTLAAGIYQVVVKIDSNGNLAETNEGNNEVVVKTITVAAPFVDLGVSVNAAKTKLPTGVIISGSAAAKATLVLSAVNNGNVPTAKTQTVDVSIKVKPKNGGAAVATFPLITGLKLGNLANGKAGSLTLPVSLPAGIPEGEYILEATVAGTTAITGDNTVDNTAATSAASALDVQEGKIVLTLATATENIGAAAVGSSAGKGSVTFKNDGNVPMVGQVKIQYFASTNTSIAGLTAIGEKTVTVNLAPGATLSKAVDIDITLPNPNSTTTFNLIAVVSAVNFVDAALPAAHNKTAGSVSVSKYTSIWPAGIGDRITFHATTTVDGAGQFMQSGTFTGSNGATGDFFYTYTTPFGGVVIPEQGHIGLSGSVIAGHNLKFFGHHGVNFNGKTVTFNSVSTGAVGEIIGDSDTDILGYIHL